MTIRIFVGTSPNGQDAEAQCVLEYTLRKNTKENLEITWMKLTNDKLSPFHGWSTLEFSTPFTPFRWAIPEICNFKGRAIYMDVDTICVGDIADLWNQDMCGNAILVKNKDIAKPIRTCVSMWDCAQAKKLAPALPPILSMKRLRDCHGRCCNILAMNINKVGEFNGDWNCVDLKNSSLDDPNLKVIHCSSIPHQPHQTHTIKRIKDHWYDGYRYPHWRPELITLFDDLLEQASENGYILSNYIPKETVIYIMQSYKNRRVKGYA